MKIRRVRIAGTLLKEWMRLPESADVFDRVIEIHITSPDFSDVNEGEEIPVCCPLYQRDADGSVKMISWGEDE